MVFFNAALTMFAGGFLAFFGIINTPIEIGLEDPNSFRDVASVEADDGVSGKVRLHCLKLVVSGREFCIEMARLVLTCALCN